LFNRNAALNRMPFSRPFSVDIMLSAILEGKSELIASLTMDLTMNAQMNGEGELIADLIREFFMSAEFNGIATMDVEMIRERLIFAALNGQGSLQGNLSRFHVDSIAINNPFAPGDKIVIDSGKLRVMRNGQPIGYTGDFFDIHPGQNTITYTDSATGRTVQIRITYRDKYLY